MAWVGTVPSPTPHLVPPLPRGLHQAQRKRILITFQEKQQLEKITASCFPAPASLRQAEQAPQPPVLPCTAQHYLVPWVCQGSTSPVTIISPVLPWASSKGLPGAWEVLFPSVPSSAGIWGA